MILYGASGHAKVIMDILLKNKVNITAIIDDNKNLKEIFGFKVDQEENVEINQNVIISIGNNKTRELITDRLKNINYGIAIHPKAIIDETSFINKGTVIMANAIINSSVKIGKHCIINTNAVIEHECIINDFSHISPSATLCGNVFIGKGTHIGAGAIINPNIKIGKWCVIGAGAVVIKDIPDNVTVVGNPARVIKQN